MKKWMALALAALMMAGLAACGSKKEETKNVDLAAFYQDSIAAEYGWDENTMADIEGEMLEMYYPGLAEITAKQMVAKAPRMSAVVNEVVFLECETEEDAKKASDILQQRIDTQAEGGAWYPESMEAWGRGVVDQQGTYVAMIASAQYKDAILESWQALFA